MNRCVSRHVLQPEPGRPAFQRILANTLWLLGGKGFGAVLSLVYLAIVTRSLGLTGFGAFALYLGVGQTVAALVNFQSWQVLIRFGTAPWLGGDHAMVRGIAGFCLTIDLISAAIGLALAAAAVAALAPQFGWSGKDQLVALLFSAAMLLAIRSTPIGILRMQDRFARAAACDALVPVTRFAGAIIVWLIAPGIVPFLIVWALSELISAAGYWASAFAGQQGIALPRPSLAAIADARRREPGIVAFALVSNLSGSLNLASRQLAVLLVGLFTGPAGAGAYRLAQQFAQAMAQLAQMLGRAMFPELVRSRHAASDGDSAGATMGEAVLARSIRLALLLGVLAAALVAVAGQPLILMIAGTEFLPAWPIFLWLGLAATLDLAGVAFEPALFAAERERLAFGLRLVATVVLLLAMVALLPRVGPVGGGIAVLASSATAFVLMAIGVRRLFRR